MCPPRLGQSQVALLAALTRGGRAGGFLRPAGQFSKTSAASLATMVSLPMAGARLTTK